MLTRILINYFKYEPTHVGSINAPWIHAISRERLLVLLVIKTNLLKIYSLPVNMKYIRFVVKTLFHNVI